jgi:hypothetical protein
VTDGKKIHAVSKAEQVRRAFLAEIIFGGLSPGERVLEARAVAAVASACPRRDGAAFEL